MKDSLHLKCRYYRELIRILHIVAKMMLIVLNFSFLNWPEIVLAVGVF